MVARFERQGKGDHEIWYNLSPKFGFQLMAKSGRAIQPTVYSNKPGCQSDFSTSPRHSLLVAHCCFSLTLNT